MTNTRTLVVERSTSTAHRLAEYDGACGNIHGHNMEWEVEAEVDMEQSGADNMPIDLKDISEVIDEVDHATILSEQDPFLQIDEAPNLTKELVERGFGDVIWFESDPTCEQVAQWMAYRLVDEFDPMLNATVSVAETDKYGITAFASNRTNPDAEVELSDFDGGQQ